MRRRLVLGLSIALGGALLAIPTAWAQGGSRYVTGHLAQHHGYGQASNTGHLLRHLLRHRQEIGLDDEQIAKLRAVALDADRAAIRASADRLISERDLRALMWDTKTDMPAIEEKVKEAESRNAAVRILAIRAKHDMIALLTPDQQVTFKALGYGRRHHDGGTRRHGERAGERNGHESDAATPAG